MSTTIDRTTDMRQFRPEIPETSSTAFAADWPETGSISVVRSVLG